MPTSAPARLPRSDIRIRRGDTYRVRVTFGVPVDTNDPLGDINPVDISGWTFLGQIRATTESSDVIATFSIVVVDAVNGVIEIVLSAVTTAALPTSTTRTAEYDIQYTTAAGDVKTFRAGTVHFDSDVARP